MGHFHTWQISGGCLTQCTNTKLSCKKQIPCPLKIQKLFNFSKVGGLLVTCCARLTKKSVRLQSGDRFLGKTKRTRCDAPKPWTRRAPYCLQCKQRARSRREARRLAKQPPPFCFLHSKLQRRKDRRPTALCRKTVLFILRVTRLSFLLSYAEAPYERAYVRALHPVFPKYVSEKKKKKSRVMTDFPLSANHTCSKYVRLCELPGAVNRWRTRAIELALSISALASLTPVLCVGWSFAHALHAIWLFCTAGLFSSKRLLIAQWASA